MLNVITVSKFTSLFVQRLALKNKIHITGCLDAVGEWFRNHLVIVAAAVILATIRAYMFFQVVLRSSESLHDDMVTALLKAPVLFFDSNPIGRILNRFSKDIGCMDEVLPKTFLFAVQLVLFVLTAALVPLIANAWLAAVVVPIIILYVYIARYFMKTSRELKRLESVCRSPVLSHISETLDGLDTIRSRGRQREFADQLHR